LALEIMRGKIRAPPRSVWTKWFVLPARLARKLLLTLAKSRQRIALRSTVWRIARKNIHLKSEWCGDG
jgi:hypothetical protein